MPVDTTEAAIALFELGLLLTGLVLLWRLVVSPAARARVPQSPPAITPWRISISNFFLYTFVIVGCGLLASLAAGMLTTPFKLSADARTIIGSAAFQFGLLLGPALVPLDLGHPTLRPPLTGPVLRSGLVTFLIALPIITAANILWLAFLKVTGLPVEQQDLLRMFSQAESTGLLVLMIVLAIVIAPIAEELLFRATIFRYLRTRLPRWVALLLPGTIFAALHVDWITFDGLASFVPLITLAVVFSLAYERTGRIATVMVAHAIFNLHTLVLLFAGVTP
jgi:membrane protease YdiL (CAAX protease family)